MVNQKNIIICILLSLALYKAQSQNDWNDIDTIQLPSSIGGNIQEYSGLAIYGGRLYLLPQFGEGKRENFLSNIKIHSIRLDSIDMKRKGMENPLQFRSLEIHNLNAIKDSIANYEGYEAITFEGDNVYITIETTDTADNCYLLEGRIDTINNAVNIDANRIVKLKRPKKNVFNAGFESITYLDNAKKLLAIYEYNAGGIDGGKMPHGYLIDPISHLCSDTIVPTLYFRMTEICSGKNDELYGINYYYKDCYKGYVNGKDSKISDAIPDLRDSIKKDDRYLTRANTHYARIVKLVNEDGHYYWKQIRRLPYNGNRYKDINWEGMVLYKEGVLLISDAQGSVDEQSKKLSTVLAYCKFPD